MLLSGVEAVATPRACSQECAVTPAATAPKDTDMLDESLTFLSAKWVQWNPLVVLFIDTRPFWSERFSNIFFPSVSCLFILLKEFSSEQKFLICLEFSLSVFPFTDYAFGVMSKNFPDPRT